MFDHIQMKDLKLVWKLTNFVDCKSNVKLCLNEEDEFPNRVLL
jgi:hypothetical protein